MSVGIALLISSDLMNRIKLLMGRTTELAEGKLGGQPLDIAHFDGWGKLGNSINQMQQQLRAIILSILRHLKYMEENSGTSIKLQ